MTNNHLQQEIAAAARTLFEKEGYEQVSMRKIARKIGYSPTTIYLYFKNKEALLKTILEEGYHLFFEQLSETLSLYQHASNETKLTKLCEAYINFGCQNPNDYHMMFVHNMEVNIACIENNKRFQGFLLLQEVVEAFIKDLHPRTICSKQQTVQAISHSIWANLHGLTSLLITFPQFDWGDVKQLVHLHIQTILTGFKTGRWEEKS